MFYDISLKYFFRTERTPKSINNRIMHSLQMKKWVTISHIFSFAKITAT